MFYAPPFRNIFNKLNVKPFSALYNYPPIPKKEEGKRKTYEAQNKNESKEHFRNTPKTKQIEGEVKRNTFTKHPQTLSQNAKHEARNKNESKKHFRKTPKTKQYTKTNQRPLSKNANNEATVTKLRKLATPANYVVNSVSLPI